MDFTKIKKELADKYIDDEEQKQIFLNEATQVKHWANYIAAIILTKKGKTEFHVSEIHKVLERLLPQYYNKPGMKESGLLTQDVEINSNWHNGLPCLERIERKRGWYRFVGFPSNRQQD